MAMLAQRAKKDQLSTDNSVTDLLTGNIHTLICLPSWNGSLDAETQTCVEKMVYFNLQNDNPVTAMKSTSSLIWDNRNRGLDMAIKIKAKYVLFVDSDMIFPPDIIQRLEMHKKPVVSAMAFVKTPPFVPNMYNKVTDIGWPPITKFKRGELLKVDCVGGALMLVEVDAVKDLPVPYFSAPPSMWAAVMEDALKLFETNEDHKEIIKRMGRSYQKYRNEKSSIGEDYFFSERLRRAGIPLYVDTSVSIGHMGRYMFAYDDFAAQVEDGVFSTKEALYDSGSDHESDTGDAGSAED